MKDALQDLLQTLEAAATEAGVVTGLVDSINKSIIKVKNIYAYYFLSSYVKYHILFIIIKYVFSCFEISFLNLCIFLPEKFITFKS